MLSILSSPCTTKRLTIFWRLRYNYFQPIPAKTPLVRCTPNLPYECHISRPSGQSCAALNRDPIISKPFFLFLCTDNPPPHAATTPRRESTDVRHLRKSCTFPPPLLPQGFRQAPYFLTAFPTQDLSPYYKLSVSFSFSSFLKTILSFRHSSFSDLH